MSKSFKASGSQISAIGEGSYRHGTGEARVILGCWIEIGGVSVHMWFLPTCACACRRTCVLMVFT